MTSEEAHNPAPRSADLDELLEEIGETLQDPEPPPPGCGPPACSNGVLASSLGVQPNSGGEFVWAFDPATLLQPIDAHVTLVIRAVSTNPAPDSDNIYWFLMIVDD